MKKQLKTLVVIALGALAAACAQDEARSFEQQADTQVSFSAALPAGAVSRAATNDGLTATELHYAVFASDATTPALTGEALVADQKTMQDGKTTVDLQLVSGQTYDLVFWAQAPGQYAPNWSTKSIAMNYLGQNETGSNELRDAFVWVEHDFKVSGAGGKTVYLKRPFAQLNIGLTKGQIEAAADAGFVLGSVEVTASTHQSFSVAEGQGEPNDNPDVMSTITFPAADYQKPVSGQDDQGNDLHEITVAGTTYDWVSFNYLLACTPSETTDVQVTFWNTDKSKSIALPAFTWVPVERNHRTNIVGDLLTDPTNFNVEIKPGFEDDDYVVDELIKNSTELAEAVKEAGATIYLAPNTTYTLPSEMADGVTIVGAEGTVVEVAATTVAANNVTLKDMTILNDGKSTPAINLKGLNPTLENLVFLGPTGNGRAVNVSNSAEANVVTVVGCDFSQADFLKDMQLNTFNGTLKIDKTNFGNGYWTFHIDSGSAVVEVTNSKVYGFTTNGRTCESLTFTNCEFGRAYQHACANLYTTHTFVNCTFPTKAAVNNISNYGLYVAGSAAGKTMTITNCQMSDGTPLTAANFAVADGGFVAWDSDAAACKWVVNDTTIIGKHQATITLGDQPQMIYGLQATKGITLEGRGTLTMKNTTITASEGDALALAEDAQPILVIAGEVSLTGATSGNGIKVPASAWLTVVGPTGKLTVKGNGGVDGATNVLGGSGIGNAGAYVGLIDITGLKNLTAEGYGRHAYGIGGDGDEDMSQTRSLIQIGGATQIDFVRGGFVQPNFVNDTSYGKSEPEGGPAIGGRYVIITGHSKVLDAQGGSKAAAIGAAYHRSTAVAIADGSYVKAQGGNASAAIGGSRYGSSAKHDVEVSIGEEVEVVATGGEFGAGIGAGYDTHCNGQNYTAKNEIYIAKTAKVTATGGKYGAGIGTGYHAAYLSGMIEAGAQVTATAGASREKYTIAQGVGYGVVDPAREFSGANAQITFQVAGQVIAAPTVQ
ncbi:MAG: hypothetical protein IJ990_00555 [Alistipes sp.]|nr:hypothetical protein [Alistipes sp.]MBR7169355.1 hypothetical protein [Alistipes sp.]